MIDDLDGAAGSREQGARSKGGKWTFAAYLAYVGIPSSRRRLFHTLSDTYPTLE